MANNTTAIDQVVDPIAVEQFVTLQKAGKELRTELSQVLQIAIDLNAALGGSTPAQFTKNLKAASDATDGLIRKTNQLQDVEAKKAAKQDEIYNKYLIMLSKQEAARQQADAKELQQAEQKAAKLQAIQDKTNAEVARKAAVQFPTGSGQPYNPVTADDSPAIRNEPIITGNEDMQIPINKTTEAIQAENIALLEQQEVLAGLSVAQRANLELLLTLQAERAENAAELKTLNVEDAVSGERAVFLTQRQLELKIAIGETTVELSRQTKEMLAADTSMKKLDQSVLLLRNSYEQLTVVERESVEGQKMLVELNALDTENKALAVSTGNTTKEVGAYEKAIAKVTNGSQLAATAVNIATRSIIRMIVQLVLFSVVLSAAEWLYKYIAALQIFNPVANAAERAQKALNEAFKSADYEKGIENIENLGASFNLVKKGLEDSDSAINAYNKSIGETFGYVNNLNDAQQGFIDHKEAYIKTIIDEAAAQQLALTAAKEVAELGAKNQDLRNFNDSHSNLNDPKGYAQAVKTAGSEYVNLTRQSMRENEITITENEKRMQLIIANATKGIEGLKTDENKQTGKPVNGTGTTDAIGKSVTDRMNEALERQKANSQEIINDEKQTYSKRFSATNSYYSAELQIAKNNEDEATKNLKDGDERKLDLEAKYQTTLNSLKIEHDNQRKELTDKQYKQDQEILKNNLTKQLDIVKGVLEDPNISYDTKVANLSIYNKRGHDLINQQYDESIKNAGRNSESRTIAGQDKDNADQALDNDTTNRKTELDKAELERHKKLLAEIITADKEAQQEQLEDMDQGATLANQIRERQKNKLIEDKDTEFANGKITEKEYHESVQDINDAYNIKKIADEIKVQRAILEIRRATRDKELNELDVNGGTQEQKDKVNSDANKDIQGTLNKLGDLGDENSGELGSAITTRDNHQTEDKSAAKLKKQKEITEALEDTKDVFADTQKLIDRGYEHQISKLEKIGKLIDENAAIERAAVDRSLDTQSNKARAIAVIEAQTASQQKSLQSQINAEKTKQAKENKAAAIAEIILNTAIGISKVIGQTGIFGLPLVPIVAALGAVQLALAIATPIPTFAKGGTHKGGLLIYGEQGREKVEEPGKAAYYSPEVATLAYAPAGTKITPNNMLPQTPKWESNHTGSDNRDVVAAIDRLARKEQPKQRGAKLAGWVEAQRQADAWNRYTNNHFR